jgi:hypothetical protein
MDPTDFIQLAFAATTALVLGRMGFALARYVERRLSGAPGVSSDGETRLQAIEEECALLHQELSELQERQDFTERVLHQDPGPGRLPRPDIEKPFVTPH